MPEPVITFVVTEVDEPMRSFKYTLTIHRHNGNSVESGMAMIDEELQVMKSELAGG